MFSRNKKINYGVKKIDKIVTGIIIGSAIASIFGLSQTKKGREITNEIKEHITPQVKTTKNKIIKIFGKTIAFFVSLFSKK